MLRKIQIVVFYNKTPYAVTAAVDTDIRKSQGIFFLKHRCKSINYTISLKAPLNYLITATCGYDSKFFLDVVPVVTPTKSILAFCAAFASI